MTRAVGDAAGRARREELWADLVATGAAVRGLPGCPERARSIPRGLLFWAAMTMTLALSGAVAGVGSAVRATRVIADSGADSALFSATNQDRSSNGVGPLTYNGTLQNVGEAYPYSCGGMRIQGRSYDMLQRNYFGHVIQGCNQYVFSMMAAAGVPYQSAGENIGWASGCGNASGCVAYINNAFMNSPDHRSNILNGAYTGMGVGTDWTAGPWTGAGGSSSNVSMYTEVFVQQGSAPPPPPAPTATPRPVPAPTAHASAPPAPAPVFTHNDPQPTPGLPPAETTPAATTPSPEPTPAPTQTPDVLPGGPAPLRPSGAAGAVDQPGVVLEPVSSGLLGESVESVLEGFLL